MQMQKIDLINALNGATIDETKAKKADMLETIESVFGIADGVAKVKKANEEIVAERESLKTEKTTLKAQIDELNGKIKTMTANGNGGAQVAELEAQLNRMKTDMEILRTETKAEREARITSENSLKKEKLRSTIIGEATKFKVRKPERVVVLMESEGLVETNEKGEPIFYRINAGRKEAASVTEAMEAWAKANPGDIEASGNAGSGAGHSGGQQEKTFNVMDALAKGHTK
jgi:TolA-binding protein